MDKDIKDKITRASNQNSLILIMWFVLTCAFMSALYLIAKVLKGSMDIGLLNSLYELSIYLSQYIFAVPAAIFFSRKIIKDSEAPPVKSVFCKPQASAGQVFKWLIISGFLVYSSAIVTGLLYTLIQNITGWQPHDIDMTTDENPLSRITTIISMMFLAPLFEEMMFRASIVRNGSRFGSWSIIIISGITFGIWHSNYAQLVYTAVMGVCAGFLTIKTRSVIPSLILHFTMNTIGTVQSLALGVLDEKKMTDMSYIFDHLGSSIMLLMASGLIYILILAGLILFIIELVSHKETFRLDDPLKGEKGVVTAYLTAPLTIAMMFLFIIATVARAVVL